MLKCHPEEPHPSRTHTDLAGTPPPPSVRPEPKEEVPSPFSLAVCRRAERQTTRPEAAAAAAEETYTACCPGAVSLRRQGRALTQPSHRITAGSKGGRGGPPRWERAPEAGRGDGQLDSSVAAPVTRRGVSIAHLRAAGGGQR